jgi:hypothetical protein
MAHGSKIFASLSPSLPLFLTLERREDRKDSPVGGISEYQNLIAITAVSKT